MAHFRITLPAPAQPLQSSSPGLPRLCSFCASSNVRLGSYAASPPDAGVRCTERGLPLLSTSSCCCTSRVFYSFALAFKSFSPSSTDPALKPAHRAAAGNHSAPPPAATTPAAASATPAAASPGDWTVFACRRCAATRADALGDAKLVPLANRCYWCR
jgi:hypothetical protein